MSQKHLFWSDVHKKTEPSNSKSRRKGTSNQISAGHEYAIPDCRHWRQRFELNDRIEIFASAIFDRPADPDSRGDFVGPPHIGLYLDERWAAHSLLLSPGPELPFLRKRTNAGRIVLWPWADYEIPDEPRLFARALKWLLREAGKGKVIEIGCMGGHGRTGTVLACLLVLQGANPATALTKVWTEYCSEAVESRAQQELVRQFGP